MFVFEVVVDNVNIFGTQSETLFDMMGHFASSPIGLIDIILIVLS